MSIYSKLAGPGSCIQLGYTKTNTRQSFQNSWIMTEELNVEAIRNASELLNSSLLSKGYINEELKFPVIDWAQLTEDQPHKEEVSKLEIAPKIYENDKSVINIIYSLTQLIDRHQAQHKSFNRTITQKNATIEELRAQVNLLEQQVQNYEQRLDRTVHVDHISLTEQVARLKRQNKLQNQEILKLKNSNSDLQTKYGIEVRKKTIEISQLKDKLLDSRSLSNTVTYGKPFLLASSPNPVKRGTSPEINTSVIYNNKPIIDNVSASFLLNESLADIKDQELDKIATQLSQLIENLIKENSKFANFINELNQYFSNFNSQMLVLNYKNLSTSSLVNPSEEIDLNRIMNETSSDVEPFEFISRPLLSNVYKNYHYVSGLVDVAISNLLADRGSLEYPELKDTIDDLREENKNLHKKWQEAIKTLEDWKKYRLTNSK